LHPDIACDGALNVYPQRSKFESGKPTNCSPDGGIWNVRADLREKCRRSYPLLRSAVALRNDLFYGTAD
jgi:hypothetical protein